MLQCWDYALFVWFCGDVSPSCLFLLTPQCLGCHYFLLPPSILPTKRGYWDGFGFYVILDTFLKSCVNFSLQARMEWPLGQLMEQGTMPGQVQRIEADCKPVLRTASYDTVSSSWPREQMRSPNPVSAVMPLKPNHLYEKFAQLLFRKAANVKRVLYNNHSVRMLSLCALKCVQSRAPFPAVPYMQLLRVQHSHLLPSQKSKHPWGCCLQVEL